MRRLAVIVSLAAGLALPALAQDQPDTEGGRYMLRQVDGQYLRVDRESGETSVCGRGEVGWTCTLVADDRTAYEAEIERLAEENSELALQLDALRQEVEALREGGAGPSPAPEPGTSGDEAPAAPETPDDAEPRADTDENFVLELPSDEDLERLSETFDVVMRRFIEMLRSLKDDLEKQAE